jgi:2,5-furandicarboxylate decarboxylase 1
MPKDLRTYLADVHREVPDELVCIDRQVNPANYDCTAIIKHLDALKKFPVVVFEAPLNLRGEVSPVKLMLNAEISQSKAQIALGVPRTMSRMEMAEECLNREKRPVKPVVVSRDEAPVKQVIQTGADVDLYHLPCMRHHEQDGGPYVDMASVLVDRHNGIYNLSYHRMEIKSPNLTSMLVVPRHAWRIFRDYEEAGLECPVATVLGHHPAFNMGAAYRGMYEDDEYEMIGAYLQEPLRLVPSETWGDRLLVPADAEVVIEGALLPGRRMVDGPFGEAPGYLGPQRFLDSLHYEVRAITRRRDAIMQTIITPEGDKPWLDLPREGAYLRRAREAVPGVTAVCKAGRHAHFNIFIAMKKTSEGDPARAAAAVASFDHSKNIFVFDEDIDVFNPADILWALATRMQPHADVSISPMMYKGNELDPSLLDEVYECKTSIMIVDATRPLGRPFSPVSKCPDDAMARVNLEEFIPRAVLDRIPLDRTSYWA